MVYEYQWKVNKYPVSAQVAGEVLTEIENTEGYIKPASIVDASRLEDAPLHGCFEWDDTVAAEQHRNTQAQAIIRNIQVVRCQDESEVITRAFWSTENEDAADGRLAYRSIERVLGDERHSTYILEQALRELRAFSVKYRGVKELTAVIEEIDKVEQLAFATA